jgi:DNA-binding transcriptional LysR family regulator
MALLAATAGAGLAYLLEDHVKPLIACGRLVRVLGDSCALFPAITSTIRADGAFALLVEALRFRGRSASRLGGAASQ